MDANDGAAQKHWDAVASQQMMCGLSDDLGRFRESQLSALFGKLSESGDHNSDVNRIT
jgi:hypothetical protein